MTKDNIHLEYKEHAAIGYGEETKDVNCIPLREISNFSMQLKYDKELITIWRNQPFQSCNKKR